jgi:hypothetical protein
MMFSPYFTGNPTEFPKTNAARKKNARSGMKGRKERRKATNNIRFGE